MSQENVEIVGRVRVQGEGPPKVQGAFEGMTL
jgi:hypothetical protein